MRAAIIAGGRARRLDGLTKGLIEVDGVPIIDRLLGMLADLDPIIIGDPSGPYAGRAPIVADTHPEAGAPGALRTALETLSGWVFVCASDLPWLDRATVDRLADLRAGQRAVLPVADGHVQPLAGWWHSDGLSAMSVGSLKAMARSVDALMVDHEDGRPFYNVNTPADLERIRASGRA